MAERDWNELNDEYMDAIRRPFDELRETLLIEQRRLQEIMQRQAVLNEDVNALRLEIADEDSALHRFNDEAREETETLARIEAEKTAEDAAKQDSSLTTDLSLEQKVMTNSTQTEGAFGVEATLGLALKAKAAGIKFALGSDNKNEYAWPEKATGGAAVPGSALKSNTSEPKDATWTEERTGGQAILDPGLKLDLLFDSDSDDDDDITLAADSETESDFEWNFESDDFDDTD